MINIRFASLAAALLSAALAPLHAQQDCTPTVEVRGRTCIGDTFEICYDASPGCDICIFADFDDGPLQVLGLTFNVGPTNFLLAKAIIGPNGDPACDQFTIPNDPSLDGLKLYYQSVAFPANQPWRAQTGDFGFIEVCTPGSIGDSVFCDLDDDGIQDTGEPGIPDVRVLIDCGPDGITETTTDANGRYLVGNIFPADCRVTIDPVTVPSDKAPGSNCPTDFLVMLQSGQAFLDADFCVVDCAPCDGGVTALTLLYQGASRNASVAVVDRDGRVLFSGVVDSGESFSFLGQKSDGTMTNEIDLAVNGQQAQRIHTSCSRPIGPGATFGDFTVLRGTSRSGGAICKPSVCDDKPCSLTMRYLGGDCSNVATQQDSGKWSCSGDAGNTATVRVLATDKDDPNDTGARVWFDGNVQLGQTFELLASNAGEREMRSNTFLYVYDLGGTLLQSIEFHTSCSQPLVLGDRYGSLRLEGYISKDDCNGGGDPDLCDTFGRPEAIQVKYTGGDCSTSSNIQDPSKVACSGSLNGAPMVAILVTDKEDPADAGARVYFQGAVTLDQVFVIDGNGSDLRSETFVHITDPNGTSLQEVEFHTSCSQPLRTGDRFGSIEIITILR